MKEIKHFKDRISDTEVEKRINAWADITMLSLELKRAVLRKRHPDLSEDEVNELMRKELSSLKISRNE